MFKEFRTLDWAGVSVPLGVQKAHLEEELGITFRAFGAGWRYDWQSDGMLSRVVRPDSKEVSFAYDALGRRTEKTYEDVATHFVWDGNAPLHEWQEVSSDTEKADITTWLFEQNTFIPAAKLAANGESFSIVSDYLGTPLQAFDNNGNKVWEQELDIFGRKRRKDNNNSSFIPFKYQGQYEDVETGLYYNRFRYYEPNTGTYISQDPIGLVGGNPTLYGYVFDPNIQIDLYGLKKYVVYRANELDVDGNRTGKIYIGRTSGNDNMTIDQILNRRHSNHHRNLEPLQSVYETDNYKAVRGAEQYYIEKARTTGNAADQINGISPKKAYTKGYETAFADPDNNKTGKLNKFNSDH